MAQESKSGIKAILLKLYVAMNTTNSILESLWSDKHDDLPPPVWQAGSHMQEINDINSILV